MSFSKISNLLDSNEMEEEWSCDACESSFDNCDEDCLNLWTEDAFDECVCALFMEGDMSMFEDKDECE